MTDFQLAISLLTKYNCALVKGDRVIKSSKSGIAPILELLESREDFQGFYAADRIVGKAAALLYVKLKVKKLYAQTLSEGGLAVLTDYGIGVTYKTMTDKIVNRQGDGICPMEAAVEHIFEPDLAYFELLKTVSLLKKSRLQGIVSPF